MKDNQKLPLPQESLIFPFRPKILNLKCCTKHKTFPKVITGCRSHIKRSGKQVCFIIQNHKRQILFSLDSVLQEAVFVMPGFLKKPVSTDH